MSNKEPSGLENLIEALTIFVKYDTERPFAPTHCEHDRIWVHAAKQKDIPQEDADRLEELGFFWDDNIGCWSSFKFGSC